MDQNYLNSLYYNFYRALSANTTPPSINITTTPIAVPEVTYGNLQMYAEPIRNDLDNISNNINISENALNRVIKNQHDVSDIISTEMDRLNQKKKLIDDALYSKQRAINLNESYRLRNADYTSIIITFVITLAIFSSIIVLSKIFTFIPTAIYDVLSVFVICLGLFIIFFKWLDISRRDRLYYNELDLSSPTDSGEEVVGNTAATSVSGNAFSFGTCIGEQCCAPGTIWDGTKFVCIKTNEKFDNMVNSNVQPNGPYEFNKYSQN